eukprot:347560_1
MVSFSSNYIIYFTAIFTSILNTFDASTLTCPSGTTQIGGLNSDIGGCGLEGCNLRYHDHYATILDCADGCRSRSDCLSFTWASKSGDQNHPGKTVCTLYNSDIPNQRWCCDQIMCKPIPLTAPATTTTTSEPIGDIICTPNENCTIICDELDKKSGCSNKIINGKQASSLTVICSSSQNEFYGGCEFSTILCPKYSICNIECNDYYGCYSAEIYSSYTKPVSKDGFQPLLVFGDHSNSVYEIVDVGATQFNKAFTDSGTYIIKRECAKCLPTHQIIYYKRIKNTETFDAYSYMKLWRSAENIINTDFKMYSTLQDAVNDVNAWQYCNYDDVANNIGAFRDCGAYGYVPGQWCSTTTGSKECQFSVYSPLAMANNNNSVNIKCMDADGTCLKTILYANDTSNVSVSCYGSGILASKLHSSCDDFTIHIEDLSDIFHLECIDDYSCYKLNIFANNAYYLNIYARGNYALSSSYIHAENSNKLDLFCGSEESEYGCYKLYVYNPAYRSHNDIATNVNCQGHGCNDNLYFFSEHGGFDLDIQLNGCGECHDVSSCINDWNLYCGVDNLLYDSLNGDTCNTTNCNCNFALNTIKSNFEDNYYDCDIFTTDYICKSGEDCVISCMEQWPNSNGCYDKIINGANATSLTVICDSISDAPIYGACESSHIYCPSLSNAECNVQCMNKDACYDTEISTTKTNNFNLTCIDTYSCSHTNVYGEYNVNIAMFCIATDSCFDINVTATEANNIYIWCEGDKLHSAYSACNNFYIWGENVLNDIKLVCNGDSSCYDVDIYANNANNVFIDIMGDYAGFGGDIYAQNAQNMYISCKSEYGDNGCYFMYFYIPHNQLQTPTTEIECYGNGCQYLELYALNGYKDIKSFKIYGCRECSNIDDCLSYSRIYCGTQWTKSDDECGSINYIYNDSVSIKQCDIFGPDMKSDYICEDNKPCYMDCVSSNCSESTIIGNNATSLI